MRDGSAARAELGWSAIRRTSVYQVESGLNQLRNQGRLTMKLVREGWLIVAMCAGQTWEWRCGRARGSAAGCKWAGQEVGDVGQ